MASLAFRFYKIPFRSRLSSDLAGGVYDAPHIHSRLGNVLILLSVGMGHCE